MLFCVRLRQLPWIFLLRKHVFNINSIDIPMLRCSVADAINKVRASKLDLFSEAMDSYVNSVLELFNFVSAEEEGIFGSYTFYVDDANTGVKANASAVRADILSMYKFKSALGSGTYSVVKLATDKRTGEEVAIKVITKSQLSGDDTVSLNVP